MSLQRTRDDLGLQILKHEELMTVMGETGTIRRRMLTACVGLVLLAAVARGSQSIGLSGPIAGYLFDSSAGSFRPLRGIPGAATVGEPIDLGFEICLGMTLDAQRVLAFTTAGPDLLVVDLERTPPLAMPIPGVPPN